MKFNNSAGVGTGIAADSPPPPGRVGPVASVLDKRNDVTASIRESMPAELFEGIREIVLDWVARGRPTIGLLDGFLDHIRCMAGQLYDMKRGRIAGRILHVHERARREIHEAYTLGQRLYFRCEHIVAFGPAEFFERVKRQLSRAGSDETINPTRLLGQLEATAAGCRWLLDRWAGMRERLEPSSPNLPWFNEKSFQVLTLLGKEPRDVLVDPEAAAIFLASHALDRRYSGPFITLRGEVTLTEMNDLVRRMGPRVKTMPDRSGAEQGRQTLLAIVDRAIAGLKAKAEEHEKPAARDAARRAAEREFDDSPQGRKLARWERRYQKEIRFSVVSYHKIVANLREREAQNRAREAPNQASRTRDGASQPALSRRPLQPL
jgi:hypothetical protein